MTTLYNLYKKASLQLKAYIFMRQLIAGFDRLYPYLQDKGILIDVGCGYGVVSNLISLRRRNLEIYGIDIDKKRILEAQKTVGNRKNIQFQVADLRNITSLPEADVIIFFDVFHHIPKQHHESLLKIALSSLKKGGTILVKDINTFPRWKYWINYIHDTLLNGGSLHFRSRQDWQSMITKYAKITYSETYGFLYPHMLFVITKT